MAPTASSRAGSGVDFTLRPNVCRWWRMGYLSFSEGGLVTYDYKTKRRCFFVYLVQPRPPLHRAKMACPGLPLPPVFLFGLLLSSSPVWIYLSTPLFVSNLLHAASPATLDATHRTHTTGCWVVSRSKPCGRRCAGRTARSWGWTLSSALRRTWSSCCGRTATTSE